MKKFLTTLAALAAASLCSVFAQTVESKLENSAFNAVNVSQGAFRISFMPSDKYSVQWQTDEAIKDYVSVVIRDNTLFVNYDKKNLPKEVKKIYQGRKNPDPVLNLVVKAPTLQEIVLGDACEWTSSGSFSTASLNISLMEKATIRSLDAAAGNAGISLKKKTAATVNLDISENLTISTEDASNARIKGKFASVTSVSSGSSTIQFEGDTEDMEITGEGSSQTNLSGNGKSVRINSANTAMVSMQGTISVLDILSKGNSSVDVRNVTVDDVSLRVNSATVHVGVKTKLTLELTGGASVYFEGEPQLSVIKIVKSTFAPAGTK